MTTEEIKTNATKVFNTIKDNLTQARKYNKEKGFALGVNTWGRKSQVVEITIDSNSKWLNGGGRIIEDYSIIVEGKKVCKVRTHYDIAEVFNEVRKMLDTQKKVKGWSGLNYSSERVGVDSATWSNYEVSIVPKVCLAESVCPEYKSLMNFVNKYGKDKFGNPFKMGNYDVFCSAMGGKRGVLWDEYGERIFLDNKPKKCARLLEELRKARGTKDTMICERGEENYIDPEERRSSEYYEIECEGEKRRYILVNIKTPMGKVKYSAKIY